MRGGTSRDELRRVADQLFVEFVDPDLPDPSFGHLARAESDDVAIVLDAGDENLVIRVRGVLARIAATLSDGVDDSPRRAVQTALDGAELTMRAEVRAGNVDSVLRLMPSFVFLVALSVTDRDRALELSRRTAELTET